MNKKFKSLRTMGRFVRQNAWLYIGAMLSTILIVFVNFAPPLLLSEVIDSVLGEKASTLPEFLLSPIRALGGREFLRSNLWLPALTLLLLYLVSGVFTFLKGRLAAMASENIAKTMRVELFTHLQKLPFAYHVKAETGDLIQRCTSDVETVRRFLSVQLMEVVSTVLMIVVALSIMLGRSISLTMWSMLLVPLLFVFAAWFFTLVHKNFEIMDKADGKMSAVLQENLTGVRVVRAFGQQQREVEKFDRHNTDLKEKTLKLQGLLAIYWGGSDVMCMTQNLITLLSCLFFAIQGKISVGEVILFTAYVSELVYPIRNLGRMLSDMGKSLVSMDRISQIMNEPAEPEEPDAVKPDLHGNIVFDHVSFAYPDDQVEILHDVSFTIPAGSTAAFLGATGSGKSTIMYLLQRLYEPTGGRIIIGGVDIRTIDRKHLRTHVGLILQEPFLYSKSIRDNVGIALDKPETEAVEHAAHVAAAADFISRADKGWETVVGEKGVTLSGGQKQRIAIARTLMKPNHILIFDDSLSAVDTETDAQIRASLRHEQEGVTTLIISHRITTLSQADKILVIEDGRITQQGTHAELCHEEGLYQRINAIQTAMDEELQNALALEENREVK